MDRIELALRRYQEILPSTVPPERLPRSEIRVWLAEYVGGAIHELAKRATFREYASWSIHKLRRGAKSPERALIDKIEHQFQVCSTALAKLMASKLIRRKVDESFPPKSVIVSETFTAPGGKTERASIERDLVNETEIEIAQLQALAKGKEQPLVNINDYFEPRQEWNDDGDGTRVQRGEWVVAFNPELLPIGDFVVRCLLKRIKMRFDLLRSLKGKFEKVITHIKRDHQEPHKELQRNWTLLEASIATLWNSLHSDPEMQLRDACVVATQAYATFHPAPDVEWLGLDDHVIEIGRASLGARPQQWRGNQMLDRIAAALRDVKALLRHDPEQAAVEEAIASGGLVILEASQEVYWEEARLTKQLTPKQWRFLWALACSGQHGAPVGAGDVGADQSLSVMATACGRLKQRLPPSLRKLIVPGSERRTYRLDLEPHRIHLFKKPGD